MWIQDARLDGFWRVPLAQRFESNKALFSGWTQNGILAPHADFIAFAFQRVKKLPPCKALLNRFVHILPNSRAPCWLTVFLGQPFGVGLCHMIRVFGVDDRQLIFSAKFIRHRPNLRYIAFAVAVVFFAVCPADRVPDNMRMDMPGVQVRTDDIFIPPAQHAVCQFLCDLVRQFGGDFSCSEALHKVIPLHTARLVPAFLGLPYRDKKLFSQYSLGMKQRLAIALSVMHNPELLILDEPINGLDPIGIAEVRSFIRELCDAQGKTILISSHILSEVALLADDIGIIDHGVLLEEESLAELQQKNRHYIHFTVSDSEKAAHILSMAFKTRNYKIYDSYNIQLMDASMPVAAINRAFIQNGLEVSEAHLCEDTLEDYFKEVTGGEGIA